MPTIHAFRTTVGRRGANDLLIVQTPLIADASRPEIGWVTRLTFLRGVRASNAGRLVVKAVRITTQVSHTPSGLRRRLKDRPRTVDSVAVGPTRTTYLCSTQWDDQWTSTSSSTPAISFIRDDLASMVRGCIAANEGRPLVDWLVENTREIGHFLTTAGWLPETRDELEELAYQREEQAGTSEYEDDGEDRWR